MCMDYEFLLFSHIYTIYFRLTFSLPFWSFLMFILYNVCVFFPASGKHLILSHDFRFSMLHSLFIIFFNPFFVAVVVVFCFSSSYLFDSFFLVPQFFHVSSHVYVNGREIHLTVQVSGGLYIYIQHSKMHEHDSICSRSLTHAFLSVCESNVAQRKYVSKSIPSRSCTFGCRCVSP